ncbi:MAG TPA: YhgE/Pip domain-containing protein, partial [Mycobacterium sp.]|nr:YhgE/Pip domain-containing protein [Mycobacterium sp.]
LWAFWNPFSAVDKVPVALVNADQGAVVQGHPLHVGDQVAEQLVSSGELALHQVSAAEAAAGVARGDYYFSITLPSDFSAAIASPTTDQPRKAQIGFQFNDANNYLASIMGQNAAREVLNQVSAGVGAQVIGTALGELTDSGSGIKKAADGAEQLSAGLTSADDGARQIADGAHLLAANLVVARDGSATLADGVGQLVDGIETATEPLLGVLDGIEELGLDPVEVGESAAHLGRSLRSAADRVAGLGIDYGQAAVVVDQVAAALRANPDPAVHHLGEALAGAQRLMVQRGVDPATDEGLNRLRADAHHLENELIDPNSQFRKLLTSAVTGELKADVVRLRSGAAQLDAGARQLSSGLVQLADGSGTLAGGAATLAEGTGQLADGAHQLADGLRAGADQVPTWTPEQRTEVAQTLANPVGVDLDFTNRAATFGTGFAPFFLQLALFIGALIIWMLLTPLQTRAVVSGLGALRVVLASYWPAALLAVCQVVLMYTVVHFGVGLQARYTLGTIAFLILIAATFLALIQAFNAVFGVAVGRVLTLALLMFQLVSSGGVYPVETTARPFQILHPYDPMTYAVDGLRELTVGGVDSRLWLSVLVLTGILAVSLAASAGAARRNRQYTMERLHPPLEV